MFPILTLIKRWWRSHKWVDINKNYVFPRSTTLFWLNENEEKEARKFKQQYKDSFYQYCFTPGPIGVCTHIRSRNGKDRDITDYESW